LRDRRPKREKPPMWHARATNPPVPLGQARVTRGLPQTSYEASVPRSEIKTWRRGRTNALRQLANFRALPSSYRGTCNCLAECDRPSGQVTTPSWRIGISADRIVCPVSVDYPDRKRTAIFRRARCVDLDKNTGAAPCRRSSLSRGYTWYRTGNEWNYA